MNKHMADKEERKDALDEIEDPKMRAAARSAVRRHREALDLLAKY